MKCVIVVIILLTLNAFAASKKDCTVLLDEVATTQAASPTSVIQNAKIEIAELFLERSKMDDDTKSALRSLIEGNIKQKIREFKTTFGVELDAKEIRALIAEIEKGNLQKGKEATQKEQQARKRESKSLAVTKEYFSEDMSNLHQLDDSYFNDHKDLGKNEINGGGASWGGDEKYVVFRNFERKSWIYNTEAKKFLDYRPSTGVISQGGHLYAENPQEQTTVRDLDTGEQWGPFKGNPMHNFFEDGFIITRYDVPVRGSTLKDQFHILIDFRNNRQIVLGTEFTMSADHKLVVRKQGKTIEVLDVATGNVVKRFAAEPKKRELSWHPGGYFTFQKGSKLNFVRLTDLMVFELPTDDEPDRMSSDGTKLIYRNFKSRNNEESIVIYDLNTGKPTKFKDLGEFTLSPDGMYVLIHRFQTKKTIMVDLATMTPRDLPGDYERWSDNGRFVYNSDSDGQWYNHKVFDLETGKKFVVRSGFDFNFVGKTNYLLTETPYLPPKKDPTKTFVNDVGQWNGNAFSLQIGFGEAKPSPSGRFILTYSKDNKVTLSEFEGQ